MSKTKGNLSAEKTEANYIDKIIKENCKNLVPFILRKIFGLNFTRIENLPELKQQVTLEKEPDFLRKIYNDDYPDGVVLHLEFETGDYAEMDARMLFYLGLLYRKMRTPVLQYVLYFGTGTAVMNDEIRFGRLDYGFDVISIENFSYRDFINSDTPEEVILGLLADKEGLSHEEIIELILSRLKLIRESEYAVSKFTNQLIMLSRLRNLQRITIKKVQNMGIKFDINKDVLFLHGKEQGIEQGIEKGIEQGEEIGKIKAEISNILNMTAKSLESSTIADLLTLNLKFVKKVQKQALLKDKILTALKKGKATAQSVSKKLKVDKLLVEVLLEETIEKKVKKS